MKIQVVNYIELHGEEIPMDDLPEEKKKKIAEQLQDKFMFKVGYRRRTA